MKTKIKSDDLAVQWLGERGAQVPGETYAAALWFTDFVAAQLTPCKGMPCEFDLFPVHNGWAEPWDSVPIPTGTDARTHLELKLPGVRMAWAKYCAEVAAT